MGMGEGSRSGGAGAGLVVVVVAVRLGARLRLLAEQDPLDLAGLVAPLHERAEHAGVPRGRVAPRVLAGRGLPRGAAGGERGHGRGLRRVVLVRAPVALTVTPPLIAGRHVDWMSIVRGQTL